MSAPQRETPETSVRTFHQTVKPGDSPLAQVGALVYLACVSASPWYLEYAGARAFALYVTIFCAFAAVHLLFTRSVRARSRTVWVGADGIRVGPTFVSWEDVLDVSGDHGGVRVVRREGRAIPIAPEEPLEFLQETERRLMAFRARVTSMPIAELASGERAELLRKAQDSGYRGASIDLRALTDVALDPGASLPQRADAAWVVTRVDPSLVPRVRVAIEETANAELAAALESAVSVEGEERYS